MQRQGIVLEKTFVPILLGAVARGTLQQSLETKLAATVLDAIAASSFAIV